MPRAGFYTVESGKISFRRDGNWYSDDERIDNPRIALLFSQSIKRNPDGSYGNLYNDLLSYVVFAVLIFYALTIAGIFVLRKKRPQADRPYKAFGYPVIPALYILAAASINIVLLLYQTKTALVGLVIVLIGVPVYWFWSRKNARSESAN